MVVPHRIIRSWYTGRWRVGCYIWYSEEGPGTLVGCGPLLAVPNVIVHPSTASASITVLLYDGPLLCGFNVAIKGLTVNVFGSSSSSPQQNSCWSRNVHDVDPRRLVMPTRNNMSWGRVRPLTATLVILSGQADIGRRLEPYNRGR